MTSDRCPQCHSENVVFSKKLKAYVCEDCRHVLPELPIDPLRIFLSYGHDANEELVRRIQADLQRRGHNVWIDKEEIKFGDDWRAKITEGVLKSDQVLSFLSKHSTRDPGVCRDEIVIALTVKGGNIQTILVENEREVKPPVNISHIQWLDMHDWKESHGEVGSVKDEHGQASAVGDSCWEVWYQAKFAEIVRVIESEKNRRFAGEIETLNGHLNPIESEARICKLLSNGFYGREWLFEAVENWRLDRTQKSRLFWIMGAPGVGKSAFAAQLTHTRGDTVIAAQFCEWDKPDHREARRVIRSIAFQLATRLPDYRKRLLTLPEIGQLDRKNGAELFDYLLANPLKTGIDGGRERYLIVIDALDEASDSGRNPLVELLARNAERLPDWLGIVVTSRPECDVKTSLQALNPISLDTQSESNRRDLRDYLMRELATRLTTRPDADQLVERILEKSEGVFLYGERFCNDVQQGHLSLDHPEQFPQGLGGIYAEWFRRLFPDLEMFRKYVRPALSAILAACEPLPVEILQRLFHWQEEELGDFTRTLVSLFPVARESGGKFIKSYHKSLADWLKSESTSGEYFSSDETGNALLAQQGMDEFHASVTGMSTYWISHLIDHLSAANRVEAMAEVIEESTFVERLASLGLTRGIHEYFSHIEKHGVVLTGKSARLKACLDAFLASMYLWMDRRAGAPDSSASCNVCGRLGLVHGHIDLGSVDYYDNYFIWCRNCYHAWHVETYFMTGYEAMPCVFDYGRSIYIDDSGCSPIDWRVFWKS